MNECHGAFLLDEACLMVIVHKARFMKKLFAKVTVNELVGSALTSTPLNTFEMD